MVAAGFAVLAALGACGPAPSEAAAPAQVSAEFLEFANMRPENRVPKSTGAALSGGFERFCLDGGRNPQVIAAALRRADYVAAPRSGQQKMTAFVVDDRRPMVQISDDGRFCAVVAEARTGQSARIRQLVMRRFPQAESVKESAKADEFTLRIPGPGITLVALRRIGPTASGSRLILAIQHST